MRRFRFTFLEQERVFMENAYIITAASAIAVAAIYFLCVRKLGAQGRQTPSSPERHEIQP
jgi:hypothetical protein